MAKKKPTKRTTTKKVQSTENLPPRTLPDVAVVPEVDEDAMGVDGMTGKQRLFARYYLAEAGGNATKAAQLAGYKDDNRLALAVTAHRTLINANVQRALEREIGKRFGTADDVRNSISAIANGSGADYLKVDEKTGKLVPDLDRMAETGSLGLLHQLQEDVTEVDGVRISTTKRKLKLYDRLKALELLAKINGQLVDRVRHEGEVKFHPITLDGDTDIGDAANGNDVGKGTEASQAVPEAGGGDSVPGQVHIDRGDDESRQNGGLPHLDIG